MQKEKHVLGLSGGKDSAALAVYMAQNYPQIEVEYFFTDTGKELPEVYDFLGRLEGFVGKEILRLNPDRDFDFWLKQYNNFLPSPQARWCTKQLKLRPFEQWLKPFLDDGTHVYSYVAIRADEEFRDGYLSKKDNLEVRLPFKDDGIDKEQVIEILQDSGLGLPDYYDWRSRSGCTFCFYQQKIEWVRLKERHPEAFEEAKAYEKDALDNNSPFTWVAGEALTELEVPSRQEQIKADYQKRLDRQKRRQLNPLRLGDELIDFDDLFATNKSCISCHK
ncbi:phosphoadenosine phosphosulfate reductase family protein [Alphaproteobacteria bacterium]|nr:phosphoadenosine phosphosulfate reductase family protein [Alphaproteobacteria bacterium]